MSNGYSFERNWQLREGRREHMRGWQISLGPLVVRYGWHWGAWGDQELRLIVYWRHGRWASTHSTTDLLYVVFPRAARIDAS